MSDDSKSYEDLLSFLQQTNPFGPDVPLNDDECAAIAAAAAPTRFTDGEVIFEAGELNNSIYIIMEGHVMIQLAGFHIVQLGRGRVFGKSSFLSRKPQNTTAIAARKDGDEVCVLLKLTRDAVMNGKLPPSISLKLIADFAEKFSRMVEGTDFFKHIEILLIQDGGCSPGYNAVASFLVEYFEREKHLVFAARQGFKSVVSGQPNDFQAIIRHKQLFEELRIGVSKVLYASDLRTFRGAAFRTERYPRFKEDQYKKKAAENIIRLGVKCVVAIGGNGTFMGMQALAQHLPPDIKTFFIPVTIDSDVGGTESLGQHTAVEVGAEKIRCYMADAKTHDRCYLVEMMGRDGGYHALHSCIGAGAHLAVMPNSKLDLDLIAEFISSRPYTVIVVAEGYERKERSAHGFNGSASAWLKAQLAKTNKIKNKKVYAEAFTRDIRGAACNFIDMALSQMLARKVVDMFLEGSDVRNRMPTVNSGVIGSLRYDEIRTNNEVDPKLVELANRLRVEDNMGIRDLYIKLDPLADYDIRDTTPNPSPIPSPHLRPRSPKIRSKSPIRNVFHLSS